jgi:hypothetical protein
VDEDDRLAELGLDEARVDVAEDVTLFRLRRVRPERRHGVFMEAARRGAQRDEIIEGIAAVDVHALGHRPETVRRIEVAVELLGPGPPPQPLAFARELDAAEVMEVAGLAVEDLAEDAFADEIERHELDPVVAAVLHHLAVLLVLFGRFDQGPTVLDRHGRRHLGRGVLAVAHGRQANRHMPLPRRRRHDQVEVLGRAHALEIALSVRITGRLRLPGLDDPFLGPFHVGRADVTDGLDLDALDIEVVLDVGRTHAADADEADLDGGDGRGRELRSGLARNGRLGLEAETGTAVPPRRRL